MARFLPDRLTVHLRSCRPESARGSKRGARSMSASARASQRTPSSTRGSQPQPVRYVPAPAPLEASRVPSFTANPPAPLPPRAPAPTSPPAEPLVQCPKCQRMFNPISAERHIPVCHAKPLRSVENVAKLSAVGRSVAGPSSNGSHSQRAGSSSTSTSPTAAWGPAVSASPVDDFAREEEHWVEHVPQRSTVVVPAAQPRDHSHCLRTQAGPVEACRAQSSHALATQQGSQYVWQTVPCNAYSTVEVEVPVPSPSASVPAAEEVVEEWFVEGDLEGYSVVPRETPPSLDYGPTLPCVSHVSHLQAEFSRLGPISASASYGAPKFCHECGLRLPQSCKFCPECGVKVAASASAWF